MTVQCTNSLSFTAQKVRQRDEKLKDSGTDHKSYCVYNREILRYAWFRDGEHLKPQPDETLVLLMMVQLASQHF